MSSRASNPQGPGQQGQGQQQGGGASGPPSNEQLLQYLMLAKGLNRESAGQELTADPDHVKEEFQKMKELVEGGGGSGGGGQQSESGSGSSHSGSQGSSHSGSSGSSSHSGSGTK